MAPDADDRRPRATAQANLVERLLQFVPARPHVVLEKRGTLVARFLHCGAPS